MLLPEIKKSFDSPAGSSAKEYLTAKLNELKNIDNITDRDTAVKQALEVKANKIAYKKLKEILQDIMTFQEEVKPKDPRDEYGIL